jgi:murein DD-endopeptidase MepM/ murein hydrolase activator NlpD
MSAATLAAPAPAATGGAPTPAGSPPPPPSPTGSPESDAPSAGALRLISARVGPRRAFYFGFRYPRIRFEFGSDQPENDLRIDIVDAAGASIRTFFRNDVAPRRPVRIRWDGTTNEGRPAINGRYRFLVSSQAGAAATPSKTRRRKRVRLGFSLFGYAFPILGRHYFGGAGGRFGAGRSGHSHQGQDVMARCGVPLVAARGGRVQFSGTHGAAGNYLVIDGRGTGFDMAYMHLARPSPLKRGDMVRTGQPIGFVGRTGDASACHLHFEIWKAPGWYEGGRPIDPFGFLKRWDRYS